MSKFIRTLTIRFDTELSQKEVPLFRGAVLRALGDHANLLYHNHTGAETFRYSYPLIQYKRIGGKAAIVCVEEGIDAIADFFTAESYLFHIGHRSLELLIDSAVTEECDICCTPRSLRYQLSNWLALNSQNYQGYQRMEGLTERIRLLEEILTSNILSMLKGEGIDIYLEEGLVVQITEISAQRIIKYKGILMTSFDIKFLANINLPSWIGLGKSVSVGFGVLRKIEPKQ